MSDKMMKICGKNPEGNAAAVGIDAGGNLNIKRVWQTNDTYIYSGTPSGTTAISTINKAIDLKEWGMTSLRFYNTTNSDLNVMVYSDMNATTDRLLKDFDGNSISLTILKNSDVIITPDDLPILNYLRFLKLRIQPVSAPTNGGQLVVQAITKR